jgi:hypothetical protein
MNKDEIIEKVIENETIIFNKKDTEKLTKELMKKALSLLEKELEMSEHELSNKWARALNSKDIEIKNIEKIWGEKYKFLLETSKKEIEELKERIENGTLQNSGRPITDYIQGAQDRRKAQKEETKKAIEEWIIWLKNQKFYLNKRMGKYIFNDNCDKKIEELKELLNKLWLDNTPETKYSESKNTESKDKLTEFENRSEKSGHPVSAPEVLNIANIYEQKIKEVQDKIEKEKNQIIGLIPNASEDLCWSSKAHLQDKRNLLIFINKIFSEAFGENNSHQGKSETSELGDAPSLGHNTSGQTNYDKNDVKKLDYDFSNSEVCENCGLTRKEHMSGWGKINEYCSFKSNLRFKPKKTEVCECGHTKEEHNFDVGCFHYNGKYDFGDYCSCSKFTPKKKEVSGK